MRGNSGGALAALIGSLSPGAWRPAGRSVRARHIWADSVVGAVVLVLVVGLVHPTAYSAPTLRAVAETIMTLLGLGAAALLRVQFHQTRRLRKLLLLGGLLTLSLNEFVTQALPAGLHLHATSGFGAAFPLGALLVGGALVASARTPSDRMTLGMRRPVLSAALASIAAVGIAELFGWLLRGELVSGPTSQSGLSQGLHHPLWMAILVATAALYGWAAVEFFRRGRIEQSKVLPLLGQAALLLGAARLYSLALPWVSESAVSLRDGLRLVAFGFIFAAAVQRDLEMRASATRAAEVAERRRVAQDLHDGLAQDLAFIAAHGPKMAEHLGDEHPVMQAARHALAVSRDAISELSDVRSTSPREALEAIGHELGHRFGIRVTTDVAPNLILPAGMREPVGRITREAIANAARHGDARHVVVALKRTEEGLTLRVTDDGCGLGERFIAANEGFGIRSMRDRVAALGGTLTLRPARPHGTELEIVFG